MSNPNMEAKVKELMELKRMREELDAEIAAAEDEIKKVMRCAQSRVPHLQLPSFRANYRG